MKETRCLEVVFECCVVREIELIRFLMRREKTLESIGNEGRVVNVWNVFVYLSPPSLVHVFYNLFSLSKDHFEFVCCVSF